MVLYVLKRVLYLVFILVAMSLLIFAATQILPGNAAYAILGQFSTPEQVQHLELKLGLNDPIYIQYWRWASGALKGDLGTSLVMERPVSELVFDALGRSAILAGVSFVIVALLGVLLGIVAAIRHGKMTDNIIGIGSYFFLSLPEFFWGIVTLFLFSGYLGWLPATGYVPISEGIGKWALHLIMPVMTITFSLIAHVSRMSRASMLEELNSQYVKVARAKGLPERYVILRHALPNALLPTITVLAVDVGILMGGLVVIEMVFAYPGLGRLLIFAIEQKDIPLIQSGVLVITLIYACANLIADLLYAVFNPRIRYGNEYQ